ncbi:MAG: TolC family protein, partial [Planctomycetota bacterium]
MRKESIALSLFVIVGCNATPDRRHERALIPAVTSPAELVEISDDASQSESKHRTLSQSRTIPANFEEADAVNSTAEESVNSTVGTLDERLAVHLERFRGDLSSTDSSKIAIDEPLSPADAFDSSFANNVTSVNTTSSVAMNLPSVLAAVGGQHPAVSLARWRVQQAYAQLDSARVLWLPSIRAGFGFHRHDGNYQASNGDIVDVNRNSFQYGLGVAATGAGTTQQPGIVARFHFADAIFEPKVAERRAWADGHAAGATLNSQLLEAASAYTELVAAHQLEAVIASARDRMAVLAKLTSDFAEAGEGLQADADRLRTELALADARLIEANGQIEIVSARVAQSIGVRSGEMIRPMDLNLVPIRWEDAADDPAALIATGLAMRPELKESQALVAAACETYKREKYRPFVPSVLLG